MQNEAASEGSRPARVILVAGPESTGTRVLTDTLSRHPDIRGASAAAAHADFLDDVWTLLARGRREEARAALRAHDGGVLLTRRSLPHSMREGHGAPFADFPDLDAFADAVRAAGRELFVVVTVRDPVAHLSSWAKNRFSAAGSFASAYEQYRESFSLVFDLVTRRGLPFLVAPLEALVLGKERYVEALCRLLGLAPHPDPGYRPDELVDAKHHATFERSGFSIAGAHEEFARERLRVAASWLDRAGAGIVEIRGYPRSILEEVREAEGLVAIHPGAPAHHVRRLRDLAASGSRRFHLVGKGFASLDFPPSALGRYTLLALRLEALAGCAGRDELRRALASLARLVAAAEASLVEISLRDVGQLTRAFLDGVLPVESTVDVTDRLPAPEPAGGRFQRTLAEPWSASLRTTRCPIDELVLERLASAYAARLHALLFPEHPFEPIPYALGEVVEFGLGGTGVGYQAEGFSPPTPRYSWTLGAESRLLLPIEGLGADEGIDLVIESEAAVFPPEIPAQLLAIRVNGEMVLETEVTERFPGPLRASVPRGALSGSGLLEVCLHHPRAAGVGESTAPRAFGLKSLRLEPAAVGRTAGGR